MQYQIEHKTSEAGLSGGAVERLWSPATSLHPRVQKDCRHEGHGGLIRKATGVLHVLFLERERMGESSASPKRGEKRTGREEMEPKNHGCRAEWRSHWNRVLGCIRLQGPRDAALLAAAEPRPVQVYSQFSKANSIAKSRKAYQEEGERSCPVS